MCADRCGGRSSRPSDRSCCALAHTVDVDQEDPLLAAVLIDLEVTSLG
jgi:hypothetical protein